MNSDNNEVWLQYEIDSAEAFQDLEEGLLALEAEPERPEPVHRLYRGLHTLKGNSGFLGLVCIERLAHAAEDLAGLVRDGGVRLDTPMTDLLLEVLDCLRNAVTRASATQADVEAELVDGLVTRVKEMSARKRAGVPEEPPKVSHDEVVIEARAPSLVPISPMSDPGYLEIFLPLAQQKMAEIGEAIAMLSLCTTGAEGKDATAALVQAAGELQLAAERMECAGVISPLRHMLEASAGERSDHTLLSRLEHELFAAFVRIEEAYVELAGHPAPTAFAEIYRRTCADRVFASLAKLRTLLSADAPQSALSAREVPALFQHLRASCEYYGFSSGARTCLDHEDRFARVADGVEAVDPSLIERTQVFIDRLGQAVASVNRGEQIVDIEGFEEPLDPMKYGEEVTQYGFSNELRQVITRTQLGMLTSALQEGLSIYEVRADLDGDDAMADQFHTWITSHGVRHVTNATVFEGDRTLFDFLIACKASQEEVLTQLRAIEPGSLRLRLRVPGPEVAPLPPQAAPPRPPSIRVAAPPTAQQPATPPEAEAQPETVAAPARDPHGTSASDFLRIDARKVSMIMDLAGEIGLAAGAVTQHSEVRRLDIEGFSAAAHKLEMLIRELQNEVSSMRLVPIAGVFHRMHRVVREVSRRVHKQVDMTLLGEETEIDKIMVDSLHDPLVHMLRNAIDHGLETPEERVAAGKPAQGRIVLEASHEAGEVVIQVSDDGRGMDKERILARAIERGLVSATDKLDDAAIYALVCEPGFSTKDQVSELSGRGVGMDVVKTTIEGLRGRMSVRSSPGKGTRITLRLPLTLAFIDAMVVREQERLYVLPIEKVFEVFKAERSQLVNSSVENRVLVRVRGSLLPVRWIHEFYGEEAPANHTMLDETAERILVVVQTSHGKLALPVDQLLGNQQVMLKPLKGVLRNIRAAAGCGMLRTGDVAVALDCDQLHA